MGKKNMPPEVAFHGRKIKAGDRLKFLHVPRDRRCLYDKENIFVEKDDIEPVRIRNYLANCRTIEHQILALRDLTQLTRQDYFRRYKFTQQLLSCLYKHHNIVYQGVLFGSTVNGLGFRDSDVDLRIRPLRFVDHGILEPEITDDDSVTRTLRDIAFQTTRCCYAMGFFVPSNRCPVAKLTFMYRGDKASSYKEGIKYDVSMSSSNSLGSLNSLYLRFLCHLSPKFHLLATVIRYWASTHDLIVPGRLSSYALINMVIFFCQTLDQPILPPVDKMRELYWKYSCNRAEDTNSHNKCLTQIESHCLLCLDKDCYEPPENAEPVSVLLLKFFEFYLKFPYSSKIITTRPGRALSPEEFNESSQFHPAFPIKPYLNIQDPFDLKHNLTAGMLGNHFQLIIVVIRHSYERLFRELLNNFNRPQTKDPLWGLNCLYEKLTNQQKNNS